VPPPRRILIAALAVLGLLALVLTVRVSGLRPEAVAAWLRDIADSWWAPLAFVLLYAAFNLALLPATILTLTAGVVWGWLEGGAWVLLASTIGSAAPYFLARRGSGPIIDAIKRRAARLANALYREGFTTLLLLRLVPVFPYNLLNYAAGLAGIGPRDYLLATFIGTIPGIFIFTYFADSLAAGVLTRGDAFVRIVLAGALLAGLILIGRLMGGRVRKRVER
jgi:uncharacterized membrane protein YdjX (TVP38/TMEM64 family)